MVNAVHGLAAAAGGPAALLCAHGRRCPLLLLLLQLSLPLLPVAHLCNLALRDAAHLQNVPLQPTTISC